MIRSILTDLLALSLVDGDALYYHLTRYYSEVIVSCFLLNH
jgi:hypothetical protein